MPLYEFGCEGCGHIEEVLTNSAGDIEIDLTCPECEKEIMERKLSFANPVLQLDGKDGSIKKSKTERLLARLT